MFEIKPWENQNVQKPTFSKTRKKFNDYQIFIVFGQHLAIFTVFYKESESEVKKCQILEPGGKKLEKLT